MARPLRIESSDMMYHVLARGIERTAIFRDDRDSLHFLDLLGTFCERFEVEVWSYVLMRNHYHLVIKTLQPNLSRAMQWLGVSYSTWHNIRHERSGHLFQGRFKSFTIEEEAYLEQLILYVHRNPLRAGLTERLASYRWSSYPCLAYGRGCVQWLRRGEVLGLLGGVKRFRRAVQDYSEEDASLLEDLRFGIFLGSEEAFERFTDRTNPQAHPEKPQSKQIANRRSVEEEVARYRLMLGLSSDDVEKLRRPLRGRERPLRDVLIYLLWHSGAHRLSEIGQYFNVGYTSVANARTRGAEHLRKSKGLRRKLVPPNDK